MSRLIILSILALVSLASSSYSGIVNPGVLCFTSSVIQVLFHYAPLRELIAYCALKQRDLLGVSVRGAVDLQTATHVVDDAFRQLFMSQGSGQPIAPIGLWNYLQTVGGVLDQDAGEFLSHVLAMIRPETELIGVTQDFDRLVMGTMLVTRVPTEVEADVIDERLNSRVENFTVLTMNLVPFKDQPDAVHLIELMRAFVEIHEVEDRLPGSGEPVVTAAWNQITSWPEMLTIDIGRGYLDPQTQITSRLTNRVVYPEELNLAEFGAPKQYRLHAVIAHVGDANTMGHYYSIVHARNPETGLPSYFIFDDHAVVEVDSFVATVAHYGAEPMLVEPQEQGITEGASLDEVTKGMQEVSLATEQQAAQVPPAVFIPPSASILVYIAVNE